jgi:hypothetical protein
MATNTIAKPSRSRRRRGIFILRPNVEFQRRAFRRVRWKLLFDDARSQELPEVRFCQAGVAHDSAHCEGIHGIVAWNRHDAFAVGHDDMLSALTRDAKAGPFERPHGTPMRYACDARHASLDCNVDFSTLATAKLLVDDGKVLADRVGNIGQRLFLRRSLRPAAWKTGNRDCDAFVTSFQSHAILHETRILLPAIVVERPSSPAPAAQVC